MLDDWIFLRVVAEKVVIFSVFLAGDFCVCVCLCFLMMFRCLLVVFETAITLTCSLHHLDTVQALDLHQRLKKPTQDKRCHGGSSSPTSPVKYEIRMESLESPMYSLEKRGWPPFFWVKGGENW